MSPKCKFCQEPIKWRYKYGEVPQGVKNTPLNLDGTDHNCNFLKPHTDTPPADTPQQDFRKTIAHIHDLLNHLEEEYMPD